jgi:hypothetical protein
VCAATKAGATRHLRSPARSRPASARPQRRKQASGGSTPAGRTACCDDDCTTRAEMTWFSHLRVNCVPRRIHNLRCKRGVFGQVALFHRVTLRRWNVAPQPGAALLAAPSRHWCGHRRRLSVSRRRKQPFGRVQGSMPVRCLSSRPHRHALPVVNMKYISSSGSGTASGDSGHGVPTRATHIARRTQLRPWHAHSHRLLTRPARLRQQQQLQR